MIETILPIGQIVVAAIVMALILLQQRGAALGGAFGGQGGSFYSTRRGIQKILFGATIAAGILFIVLAVLNLIA